MPASESRMPASSSTIRMLGMLYLNRCRCGFRDDRQFYDKASADGLIFFHANRTTMVFDDAAHDCEPEAGTALFSREVREKKLFFDFPCDAMPGIGYGDFDRVAAGHKGGGDFDLAHDRGLGRLGGIVDQVGDRTLDRFAVRHDFGQV